MNVHAVRAKFWLFSILFAAALLAPDGAVADDRHGFRGPFERIVVFGTSLTDPGNAFALTGDNLTPPGYGMTESTLLTLIPDAPYARGGDHFSNGPTWIEDLGRALGLASNVHPALRASNGKASNYAVGGARARAVPDEFDPDPAFHLSLQVSAFLRDAGPNVPSDALYVIEMGGNDVRDALFAGANAPLVIERAVAAIGANIGRLYAAGARKFLIWNSPNLALTPAVRALDAVFPDDVAGGALALSVGFNNGLADLLGVLDGTGPGSLAGIQIVRFDAFTEINNIVANPGAFGLTDVTTACLQPNIPPFQCRRPDQHLFWDGIHPTRAAHAITAALVAKALAGALIEP